MAMSISAQTVMQYLTINLDLTQILALGRVPNAVKRCMGMKLQQPWINLMVSFGIATPAVRC